MAKIFTQNQITVYIGDDKLSQLAGENDIVAILGKGHETYQESQSVRYDFDDRVVVGEMTQKWGK